MVSSEIDSWEKLSKILAKKEQFLISFLNFVPYDVDVVEGYDKVALDVYDYLLSKSSLGKDTPNFNYTFNSSDIPMLYD